MVVVTWVMHLATASRMAQTTAATTEQGTVEVGVGGGGGGGGGLTATVAMATPHATILVTWEAVPTTGGTRVCCLVNVLSFISIISCLARSLMPKLF